MNPIAGRSRAFRIAGYLAMILVLATIALPLYWVLVTSFKTPDMVYIQPPAWWPDPVTADPY